MHNFNFLKFVRISIIVAMLSGLAIIHCSCMSPVKKKHALLKAEQDMKDDTNAVLGFHPFSLF